ncbi:MAG: phosphopantetheine-binding protein [Bacilli bacterium]|nr:phosphopantetheine-binding protein [Bacilli bacterium]
MDIRLKLSEVFASKSPNAKLEDETKLEDLGLDSLDKIELLYAIEESFGIEFENEEMQSFITIGDIVKSIEKKI